jgi:MoxR-like ATPase
VNSPEPDIAAEVAWYADRFGAVAHNVEAFVRGQGPTVRTALACVFAGGHLLIEGVPGVGKTSLAKAVAASIGATMRRIQFTPDLLPTDVTGVQVYDDRTRTFEFRAGPVFAHVVLADEVNRASPKTQSALLEVMEERQVTVDGTTYPVDDPFVVIATSNPVEHEGVYRLPEAQLDRFLARLQLGHASAVAEREVIDAHLRGRTPQELGAVISLDDARRMTAVARSVHVAPALQDYVVTVVAATRTLPECRLGASTRGGVGLAVAAQALAAAQGRTFVTADDVKALAGDVLAHRMLLRPDAEMAGRTARVLVAEVLAGIPVPRERVLV